MLAAKRALLAVLAERHALRQTAEAAAVPAAAAPSAAVHLKRPAAAVAAAPTAASKKAKVAPQPAAKEAGGDVAQLLEDLELGSGAARSRQASCRTRAELSCCKTVLLTALSADWFLGFGKAGTHLGLCRASQEFCLQSARIWEEPGRFPGQPGPLGMNNACVSKHLVSRVFVRCH